MNYNFDDFFKTNLCPEDIFSFDIWYTRSTIKCFNSYCGILTFRQNPSLVSIIIYIFCVTLNAIKANFCVILLNVIK
jgi:hypothetical protein